jgi:hypothetical protein
MGVLRMYFAGICTYFNDYASLFGPNEGAPLRRMVLVNANTAEIQLGTQPPIPIQPHVARLELPEGAEVLGQPPPTAGGLYDLNAGSAYTITVANAQPTGWINNAGCLPHLAAAVPPNTLGLPSPSVVAWGQAACYADFQHGRIDGFALAGNGGSIGVARVTVMTEGPPQLAIASTGSTAVQATVVCPEVAVVVLTNQPEGLIGDDQTDFLINFLTVADPPSAIQPPGAVGCPSSTHDPDFPAGITMGDAGPGCSNTNYP